VAGVLLAVTARIPDFAPVLDIRRTHDHRVEVALMMLLSQARCFVLLRYSSAKAANVTLSSSPGLWLILRRISASLLANASDRSSSTISASRSAYHLIVNRRIVIQTHRYPGQSSNRFGVGDNRPGRKQQCHPDSGQSKADCIHADPPVIAATFRHQIT
jgi:hypothetical protein